MDERALSEHQKSSGRDVTAFDNAAAMEDGLGTAADRWTDAGPAARQPWWGGACGPPRRVARRGRVRRSIRPGCAHEQGCRGWHAGEPGRAGARRAGRAVSPGRAAIREAGAAGDALGPKR